MIVVFFNLLSFLCCLLKEGLDGARLFAGGVAFWLSRGLRGRRSGGEDALGGGVVTGKEASNPTCRRSIAKLAS